MDNTPHPQVVAMLEKLFAAGGDPVWKSSAETARRNNTELLRQVSTPGPTMHGVSTVQIQGADGPIMLRRYIPGLGRARGVVVYFHGGGFVTGDLDSLDGVCRRIAADTDCEVLNVDYSLAPEAPFPTGVDDAYLAVHWASRTLAADRPLFVAGDSSGGNFAAVCVARATRDRVEIAGQILLYPVLDHNFATESYEEFAEGYLVGRRDMQWFWDQYLPDASRRDNPDASPLRGKVDSTLAPALILTAGLDPLRDEGRAYADKLAAAGISVDYRCYAGHTHGFVSFGEMLDAADDALADVAAFITALTATENKK